MPSAERERWGSLSVSIAALLVAVTCSRESRLEPATPVGHHAPAKAVPHATAPAPTIPSAAPAVAAPSGSAAPTPGAAPAEPLNLPRFEQALSALEAKKRKDHVRVLWLGDSHTAADFMTGALRRRLSARFGAGGPGLVRLGATGYRHEGVKLVRDGRWRIEPEPPSRRSAEGDSALGYEGMRAIPVDARARVEARVDARAVSGTVRYELLFDLPPGASFRVALGDKKHLIDARTGLEHVPGSPISRLRLEAPASDTLELSASSGSPRFYGVLAEGSEPGIVLDTSGIDGARVATALAWNPDVLAAELKARPPELVAMAYGTNEAFDNRRVEVIGSELVTLVERLRRGAPNADCLVIGPPDAAAPDLTSMTRVAEIEGALHRAASQLGCGFFALRAAMGGDGAFERWLHASPPLARGDRIHLTPAGYEQLGDAVASALIGAYDAHKSP
jgi:lysophospholipase L1-like esterase